MGGEIVRKISIGPVQGGQRFAGRLPLLEVEPTVAVPFDDHDRMLQHDLLDPHVPAEQGQEIDADRGLLR
jgi:hypothetical protein